MGQVEKSTGTRRLQFFAARTPGRGFCIGLGIALLLVLSAGHASHARNLPNHVSAGDPVTATGQRIAMARATWDTGWFQTEIIRNLLGRLGYKVGEPQTMDNREFYLSAALGQVDLWANGWFPSHSAFLEADGVKGKVEAVGFEVKAGALQGYLVDKKSADALGIKRLSDLKNPSIAAVFDHDGNGKADLVGCNAGWGCERVVEHHLDAYDLRATVEHVQGEYSPIMDDTIARYKRGQPVLFYTWTPNWTVGTVVPGKDVIWLEVPFASLPDTQKALEDRVAIRGISGCGHDPCALGFPPNDIRVVANVAFLDRHPDVRRLLELVRIPLEDISRQNAKMFKGEGTYEDIQRHAAEWIQAKRDTIVRWLDEARAFQPADRAAVPPVDTGRIDHERAALRVATQRSEPFVIYQGSAYTGFSIELWDAIARQLGLTYEIYGVNTIAKLLDDVKRGAADVAVAGIGITSKREQDLDFSHAYFKSGLQIMVPEGSGSVLGEVVRKATSIIFSRELMYGVAVFLIVLLMASHIIWLLERRHNPQFPRGYPQGLWHAIWWAVVTVTTVGYGDKTPKGTVGRIFGVVWILAGYFVFAYFTASVTTTATVQELHGTINGPQDLYGKRVATVKKSTAAEYLSVQGISARELDDVDAGYHLLKTGKVDAVVFDAPVLQHYASQRGKGRVRVVGLVFQEKNYGIALSEKSDLRDRINIALLKLVENGTFDTIREKWFGT